MKMAASSTVDPGYEVVEQLRSLSEIPKLGLFMLDARNNEDLYRYIFSEEAYRIQLLKILFTQIDEKLGSTLNSTSKKETEILDTLQKLCVTYGFSNRENSKLFIIGKMSVEQQCPIWERIIEGVKSIMNYENVANELENDVMKVDMFFRNPHLKDFLSFMPSETNQELPPKNNCDSNTLECGIRNAKLKLENYKDLEILSPEMEEASLEFNVPPILSEEQLLDSIQKWKIGFETHLEANLNALSPDKAAVQLPNNESDERISQTIKTFSSCCAKMEKDLENRKLMTEIADKLKHHNETDKENSQS